MRVVIAPDSFGGTLTARAAAEAIATGWGRQRPGDDLVVLPLADGGEGTLDVVAAAGGDLREAEVADPRGRPTVARFLLRSDGTAVVESAAACGLALVPRAERDPVRTTTYGVGQLLEAARRAGARRIAVGLGGSATVDGGAGALLALGFRLTRRDGSGVKVGGGELVAVDRVRPAWVDPAWTGVTVELWCDVDTRLEDAAATFGPQKGATETAVELLQRGLRHWADVVERDLEGSWRDVPGAGAAGGLGFGLLAGLGARAVGGAAAVAEAVGLPEQLVGADLVVTGEGRLDRTSASGKVVGHLLRLAGDRGVPVAAVVGSVGEEVAGLAEVVEAPGEGPGRDPARALAAGAERLAGRSPVGGAGKNGR